MRVAVLLIVVAALVLVSTTSFAADVNPRIYSVNGYGITINGPSGSQGTTAGQFTWRTWQAGTLPQFYEYFTAFCIEWYTVNVDNDYDFEPDLTDAPVNGGGLGFGSSQMSATAAANLEELYGRFYSDVDTQVERAAFQVAIWEIVYENMPGGSSSSDSLNVTSGDATFTNPGHGDVLSTAQGYLNALDGTGPTQALAALTSALNQDMIVPVPLPPALLVGFGLLGGLAVFRRVRRR
jgi:hypothetical protein